MEEDTFNYREELLRTVEALARRWYPSGIPRELFRNALVEALAPASVAEQEHKGDERETNTEQSVLRAVFVVRAPLDRDDEAFLKRAVTQGLRWQWEEIAVVVNGGEYQVVPMVPIVRCGFDAPSDETGDKRLESTNVDKDMAPHITLISTVSLRDARISPEAKRRFWSDLQRLL